LHPARLGPWTARVFDSTDSAEATARRAALLNGATFALSAVVVAKLRFARVAATDNHTRSLISEAHEGLRALWRMGAVRVVVLASSGALFCGGLFNVGELLLATEELDAGGAGFSALVAAFGVGVLVGSLAGAAGGGLQRLKRRYLAGLLLSGVGLLACAAATSLGTALAGFAVAGYGNGALLVHGRLLIQTSVPDGLLGRVFGIKDALTAWAFTGAFLAAGGLLSAIGPRSTILLASAGGAAVWALAVVALRDARQAASRPAALGEPLTGVVGATCVRASTARTASTVGSAGSPRCSTRVSASTTTGSNWLPACTCSSTSAS
jgi:MFS family permease